MSQALYRKYRSKSLDEIVGQDHITGILKRAIENGRVAHAYLLTGPRGVGKTSIARILAHEINKLPYTDESTHLDIIEIDAASNNSVEDVRDLREKAQIAPTSAAKKIYIIDEVHMLSKAAFNALLKTLEEPPEHIVFILATTDSDKLPATILSRVQRFNFRTIGQADATRHLAAIAREEGISVDDDALALIALHGNGSFRDSISLLDQLQNVAGDTITRSAVELALGLATADMVNSLLAAYQSDDLPTIITLLNDAESRGIPSVILAEQLIATARRDVMTNPEFLPLLETLIDVTRSAWPDIKLLTALTQRTTGQSPLAAPAIKVPAVTPKKPELSLAAVDTRVETQPKATPPEPKQTATTKKPAVAFEWEQFIAALKSHEAAGAVAILRTCAHEFDGETLTVYAGKKFNKIKLDKSLPDLMAALQTMRPDGMVTIEASAKPAGDSETAAIVAMMGGGEEVNV